MTLYETISTRRQVRKFHAASLNQKILDEILAFTLETDQLLGQKAVFRLSSIDEMNGGTAPHYILGFCEPNSSAFANIGYVLQKTDLYIQSRGLGSGWFMNAKPKANTENFCIALAFGSTDVPMRKNENDFKRLPVNEISPTDNAVAQAVRLAPSSLNSQPWRLDFADGKLLIHDAGHGMKRIILKNKLNKIDTGIAARHSVLALEHEGKKILSVTPQSGAKDFSIEISYTKGEI